MTGERLVRLPRFTRKAVEAWEAFTRSDPKGVYGLDVESTAIEGLGTYDPSIKMRTIQFGTRTEAWVLDVSDPRWRWKVMAFLNSSARFVSHNASFDATRVWFEFGIDLGDRSIDTLPMAALCWPGRTKPKGLKSLCDEFIDDRLSKADHALEARFIDLFYANKPRKTALLPKNFEHGVSRCRRPKCERTSWTGSLCGYCETCYYARKATAEITTWGWTNIAIDDPVFLHYAGLDAIYVRRLLDVLAKEINRRKMAPLSRTEQKVKRYMTKVSIKGHRIDAEWTSEILNEVGAEFEEAEDRVLIATGGVKARSPKMTEWLARQGIKTKSLDKDHLPGLLEKYVDHEAFPVLEDIAHISANSNLLSNLRTIMKHATEGDGYVHPNINTLQAHTGRMSVTGPAMQTLAKKGEKGARLRGCFIAREGHVLVGADYDSQEVRIAAALSRDEMLLKIVLEGLNQHVLTAEQIFADYVDKVESPAMYASAKTLDFAQQYGAFPKKIAATLTLAGIPTTVAEATILWQKWRHTYRGLVEWSDRLAKQRHVRNPFGRVIPRDPYRDYANANYVVQSTGRDVLGEALVRLADAGWADTFWLPIHDEMTLEVPEDRAEEACAALTEHMTTEIEGIEVPAEGEVVGTRWRGLG